MSVAASSRSIPLATRIAPALFAVVVGLGLFMTVGFAWPSAVHNATHDTRHALGLPCH